VRRLPPRKPARVAKAPAPSTASDKAPPVPASGDPAKERVAQVQKLLAALGYEPGATDGVMNLRARVAIRAFESDHGMTGTGKVTNSLHEALLAAQKAGQTKTRMRRKAPAKAPKAAPAPGG
jgi:carboxyl-terminal processing protease